VSTLPPSSNAAQLPRDLLRVDEQLTASGADVALLAGHPAGTSYRRAAGRLGTALWEVFPGHVALLDRDGVVVSVNRAWREFGLVHGGAATSGLGMNYLEVCDRAAEAGEPEAAEAAALVRAALAGTGDERRLAYPVQAPGNRRWFSLHVVPIPGQHSGALVVHIDITVEKMREQEWQHRALHDPLTGLPNRALLNDRLEHAIAGAARDPRSMALLFLDIDAFKAVNDRFGHHTGDDLLCRAAKQMTGSVRAADTVGRWGGDEFLVIAERLDVHVSAHALAGRLTASLAAPFAVGTDQIQISISIGIAHLEPQQTADQLVQSAGRALHAARSGRGNTLGRVPR
jgi:diguanylate cyclase (GGDEF)-like protein/PAS domain S-box-containing protein